MKRDLENTRNRSNTSRVAAMALMMTLAAGLSARSAAAQGIEFFNNTNTGGVGNNPSAPTMFTVNAPVVVNYIQTYHWNFGQGARAGRIGLRDQSGFVYGPFNAAATPGSGGRQNVNWVANSIAVALPAGSYTVVDSDPGTWSQNAQSQGRGFAIVRGALSVNRGPAPTPVSAPPPSPVPACPAPTMTSIRGFQYQNYSAATSLLTPTVAAGGFIIIQAGCMPLSADTRVLLSDGKNLPLRLTNVTVAGSVVTAQIPSYPGFAKRTWNVELYSFGPMPWRAAFVGSVQVQ
jgi:hypothetical protein